MNVGAYPSAATWEVVERGTETRQAGSGAHALNCSLGGPDAQLASLPGAGQAEKWPVPLTGWAPATRLLALWGSHIAMEDLTVPPHFCVEGLGSRTAGTPAFYLQMEQGSSLQVQI